MMITMRRKAFSIVISVAFAELEVESKRFTAISVARVGILWQKTHISVWRNLPRMIAPSVWKIFITVLNRAW